MKLNERSIPNRVENVAVGVHASFDVCRYVWTRISENDPVACPTFRYHVATLLKNQQLPPLQVNAASAAR